MRAHALHLPHFHGHHLAWPSLPWAKARRGLEIMEDLGLILVGALLAYLFFVPGVLD